MSLNRGPTQQLQPQLTQEKVLEDEKKNAAKVRFFEVVTRWVAREFLFARRNLVLALTPLFLGQFGQGKVLRTPKIMLFPVISVFLPKSESNWGLSLEVEKSSFTPVVFSTSGIMGDEADKFYKKFASKLSDKTKQSYLDSIRYIRQRLSFCLLRTLITLISISILLIEPVPRLSQIILNHPRITLKCEMPGSSLKQRLAVFYFYLCKKGFGQGTDSEKSFRFGLANAALLAPPVLRHAHRDKAALFNVLGNLKIFDLDLAARSRSRFLYDARRQCQETRGFGFARAKFSRSGRLDPYDPLSCLGLSCSTI
eukprot:sb/3467081/